MMLSTQMRDCKGVDKCFGLFSKRMEPVVFEFPANPHLMVVTEQPSEGRTLIELARGMEAENLKGVPARLNELFDGRFYRFIKREDLYWTHFIKCPGTIRSRKKTARVRPNPHIKSRRFNKTACADRHLRAEIEQIKPRVIITAGSNASQFVLDLGKPRTNWIDQLWKEIEAVATNSVEKFEPPLVCGAKVLVLMHPSGANPLRHFLGKLKPLLQPYLRGV